MVVWGCVNDDVVLMCSGGVVRKRKSRRGGEGGINMCFVGGV